MPPEPSPPEVVEAASFGRTLTRVGFILVALLVLELAVVAWRDTAVAIGLLQMIGLEMVAGREAGIPVALLAGAPRLLVAQVSFTQDMAAVSLVYPIALRAIAIAVEQRNWFGRRIARIDEAARRHQAWARRWGPVGIFAFMLIPFLANGPLLAAILGRGAGITTNRLIAPIVLATAIAITAWTYAYDSVLSASGAIDPRLPTAVTVAVITVALAALLVDLLAKRRKPADH